MLCVKKKRLIFSNIDLLSKSPLSSFTLTLLINRSRIKSLFHRNYLEQFVPGTFFPPDLLLPAFPSRSKVPRRLGK